MEFELQGWMQSIHHSYELIPSSILQSKPFSLQLYITRVSLHQASTIRAAVAKHTIDYFVGKKMPLHHTNVVFHWDCNGILLQFPICVTAKSLFWSTQRMCWSERLHEKCTMHILYLLRMCDGIFLLLLLIYLAPLVLWKWQIRKDCGAVRKEESKKGKTSEDDKTVGDFFTVTITTALFLAGRYRGASE